MSDTATYSTLLRSIFNGESALYFLHLQCALTPFILVSPTANSAGLNYIRVPIGASDFSPNGEFVIFVLSTCIADLIIVYSYDDKDEDTSLSSFSTDAAPSYYFSTLKDIQSINTDIKLHLVPWSPVRAFSIYTGEILSNFIASMDEG